MWRIKGVGCNAVSFAVVVVIAILKTVAMCSRIFWFDRRISIKRYTI